MKIYIVTFYNDLFKDKELARIRKCLSTEEKAQQYIGEICGMADDINIDDCSNEIWELSGTGYDVREYEVG